MPNFIQRLFNVPDKNTSQKAEEERSASDFDLGFYTSNSLFVSETNPTVTACINKIANTLGNIPLSLYVRKKGGGRTKAVFHPLFQTIKNPSLEYTPSLFWITLIRHILYYGNGYIFVSRNLKNEIISFSLLNPSAVSITRDNQYNKVFNFNGNDYTNKQILHIPYLDYDGTYGISPLSKLASLVDLDNKLFTFINNYFNNSIGSRIAIELSEAWKNTDLKEAYQTIQPLIKLYISQASQVGKPMITPPATKLTKVEQTNNAENDLRSLKQLVERLICAGFNIPYSLINEQEGKYDSTETKQLLFLSETIKPLGFHICESFQQLLEPADKDIIYLSYNYRSIIETDTDKLITTISKEIQTGLLTVNEGRNLLDLEEIGEVGDYSFIPAQLMPLTQDNINAYMGSAKSKLIDSSGIGDDKL